MCISDWSSYVCSSDLGHGIPAGRSGMGAARRIGGTHFGEAPPRAIEAKKHQLAVRRGIRQAAPVERVPAREHRVEPLQPKQARLTGLERFERRRIVAAVVGTVYLRSGTADSLGIHYGCSGSRASTSG